MSTQESPSKHLSNYNAKRSTLIPRSIFEQLEKKQTPSNNKELIKQSLMNIDNDTSVNK